MAITDRILLGFPADPECYLATLAVVQDYGWQLVRQREDKRREGEWLLAIHSPNPKLDFLKKCFPRAGDSFTENEKVFENRVDTEFVAEWAPKRGDWDMVYKFDEELTYDTSQAVEMTAPLSFGLLIGAAPKTELPDLSKLGDTQKDSECDVCLLPFDGRDELQDMLELHYPDMRVCTLDTGGENPEHDWINVAGIELVIGPRSFATYVAAAMGARVIELYGNDRHPKWLSKWAGRYQQVYGQHFPVALIWRAVEEILTQWPLTMRISI